MNASASKSMLHRIKKLFLAALTILLLLYAGFAGTVAYVMTQSPETFGRFMSHMPIAVFFVVPFETFWMHARAGTLHVNDPAPDFSLPTLDKSSTVTLSSFRGQKPVVLIFGSYT